MWQSSFFVLLLFDLIQLICHVCCTAVALHRCDDGLSTEHDRGAVRIRIRSSVPILIGRREVAHDKVGALRRGHTVGRGGRHELLFVDVDGAVIHRDFAAAHLGQLLGVVVTARGI